MNHLLVEIKCRRSWTSLVSKARPWGGVESLCEIWTIFPSLLFSNLSVTWGKQPNLSEPQFLQLYNDDSHCRFILGSHCGTRLRWSPALTQGVLTVIPCTHMLCKWKLWIHSYKHDVGLTVGGVSPDILPVSLHMVASLTYCHTGLEDRTYGSCQRFHWYDK